MRKTHINPLKIFDRKSINTNAKISSRKKLSVKNNNETQILISNKLIKLSQTNKQERIKQIVYDFS